MTAPVPTAAAVTAPAVLGAGDAADPHVLRVGESYFLYTTMSGWTSVPVWRSADHGTWTFVGDALPVLPGWADWGWTWAPGVLDVGDRFVLYFTTRHSTSQRQCIGVAEAERPEGPFTPRGTGPLVADIAYGGSIDAYPFRDRDGSLYLYWKVDANAVGAPSSLWGARLAPSGLALAGAPVRLLVEDAGWERPTIENPSLVGTGSGYLLIYSGGWWESVGYGMGSATCAAPLGPCTKRTAQEPWTRSVGALVGLGGGSFFLDARGVPHLVAHAWTYPSVGYAAGGTRRIVTGSVSVGATPTWHLFADVDPASVHAGAIERAVQLGLLRGRADDRFLPAVAMTRGQAATTLVNLLGVLGSPTAIGSDAFRDDDGSAHEPSLDALAGAGLLVGDGRGTVAPDEALTRGQLATLLDAVLRRSIGFDVRAAPDAFVDDEGSVHEPSLDALAAAGLLDGVGDGRVAPQAPVSRAQVATLVVTAVDAA